MAPKKSRSANPVTEPTAAVYVDHQRHVALQLARTTGAEGTTVEFIRLNVEDGLDIESSSAKKFDGEFTQLLVDYPADRAAKLMISYARSIGATETALRRLGKLSPLTEEDITMATTKKASRAKASSKGSSDGTAKTRKAPSQTKKKAATKAAAKSPRLKGETASKLFQELIRQGSLTDDQIFAKVKTKFNLDDSKRGYVGWYRNHMRKNGEKVPDAK